VARGGAASGDRLAKPFGTDGQKQHPIYTERVKHPSTVEHDFYKYVEFHRHLISHTINEDMDHTYTDDGGIKGYCVVHSVPFTNDSGRATGMPFSTNATSSERNEVYEATIAHIFRGYRTHITIAHIFTVYMPEVGAAPLG